MHNRRRSAKRKLWEITAYKHTAQHISDSDDDKEQRIRENVTKKSCKEKSTVENWISQGSSFNYEKEFKRNEIYSPVLSSGEKTLIEIVSCSDNDSSHDSQVSIGEISCSSKNSVSFCTKEMQYDVSDDSSDHLTSTPIFNITEDSQKNFSSNEQAHNISSTISPPSSPMDSSTISTKGSEWLSTIPWQPRTQKEFHPQSEDFSDKKKKKYLHGGFADQLHRLQSREKTAKAFWDHHNQDTKDPLCGKDSLVLKLVEVERNYGTAVCKAVSLKSQSLSNLDDGANLAINNITNEELYENCIVLLDYEQCEELNISTGSIIQLFPPWKSVHVTNLAEPVLLCTFFLQVLNKADHLFTWNCQKQEDDIT